MMPRRKLKISKRFVIIAAVAAFVVGAPVWYAWWWWTDGRYPLTGETFHDFGDMDVTDGQVSRTHVFTLRNRRDVDVVITKITPGCGCTTVEADRMVVPPGGAVALKTTLTISKPRERDEHAILLIEDFGPQYIWIHADGVYDKEVMRERHEARMREMEGAAREAPAERSAWMQGEDEEAEGGEEGSGDVTPEG
jgi:hypothetical protein